MKPKSHLAVIDQSLSQDISVGTFLRRCEELREGMGGASINGYSCLEAFVLKNGVSMTRKAALPKGVKRAEPGLCFMNATLVALRHPELIYCEGYGHNGILPIMHAWNIDPDGNVIDVTWNPDTGIEYFGIPIRREFLYLTTRRQKVYGLIDRFIDKWPMLRIDPQEFTDPIINKLKNENEKQN